MERKSVSVFTFGKNGQLASKGDYDINDEKVGEWINYWSNGQLKSKGNYNKNNKEGLWVS